MKVSLFVTCLVDQFYPQIGLSAVRILERLGVGVDFDSRQTCCGQPAFNSGYTEEARQIGCGLLDLYQDQEWIVTPSGSCCSMIKVFLPKIVSDDHHRTTQRATMTRKRHKSRLKRPKA